jgi:hypothetical protein
VRLESQNVLLLLVAFPPFVSSQLKSKVQEIICAEDGAHVGCGVMEIL